MKTPNNLCFKASPKNENYITLIKEIHRVDLKNFYSIKFIIPTNNLNIKRGISKKDYFYLIGNKGLNFFDINLLFKNPNIKKVFNNDTLYIYLLQKSNVNTLINIRETIQIKRYSHIKKVLIGFCKKIYIKGKGKKFTTINQKNFNVSNTNDKFWEVFFKKELKNYFKKIPNQGFLLDLNSNDEKKFKSIIHKDYTIILEVLNKTEVLLHSNNKKSIGDFIYKIKKNYPINAYTGEGIHTTLITINPTKNGKKL